jgi:hypothetical protein
MTKARRFLTFGVKVCTRCRQAKPFSAYTEDRKTWSGLSPHCRVCRKAVRQDPYVRERDNASRAIRRAERDALKHPRVGKPRKPYPSKRVYFGLSHKEARRRVLVEYGGRCNCCGETEPAFLCIDHIHNDGKEHRKEVGNSMVYRWLLRNGCPKDRFQLLCYNCNMTKEFYGECPHQKCEVIPFPVAC